MHRLTAFLLMSLGFCLEYTGSAKILVFLCQVGRSHHLVFHPIIKELSLRGHEVDYYTHYPVADPPPALTQYILPLGDSMKNLGNMSVVDMGESTYFQLFLFLRQWKLNDNSMACAHYPEVQELFASKKKYDLVLGEFHFVQEDLTVLMHKFNALGVSIFTAQDSVWVNEMASFPANPSYMIDAVVPLKLPMTLWEKLQNLYIHLSIKLINWYYLNGPYQEYADKHWRYDGWESRPSIKELSRDMSLILTNSHQSIGNPNPKAPHVKEVLGINIDLHHKPLPKDLQEFMDGAEDGLIYFSMGSFMSVDNLRLTGAYEPLLNVMKTVKQRVLWKWTSWSGEEIPTNLPPNIKMSKWLPQQSVLAHNRTSLFITHCGLGGLTEAVNYGVPLIGLPVLGDQLTNALLMDSAGYGIQLDIKKLSESSLSNAINEILNNPSYKIEATRRQALFRDRPMKPVQEAVYWIEYVIKHGKVLQPASTLLPLYQLYLLDILGFIVIMMLVSVYVLRKFCCATRRILKLGTDTKQKTSEKSAKSKRVKQQ